MQKSTLAKILALAAVTGLAGCGQTPAGQEPASNTTTDRTFYVNTAADAVNEVIAARQFYNRITDFQTGQLCTTFADAGMQCTSFADLNEQQTSYVAQMRARLDAAKRPAANASR